MIKAHHIALNCKDIKTQEKFYTEVLGFKRVRVFNKLQSNEFIMLRLDSFCIGLFTSSDSEINLKDKSTFKHFAFSVDSLEKYKKILQSHNISIEKEIDHSKILEGFKICFFSDPEGNTLELMEGYEDEIF